MNNFKELATLPKWLLRLGTNISSGYIIIFFTFAQYFLLTKMFDLNLASFQFPEYDLSSFTSLTLIALVLGLFFTTLGANIHYNVSHFQAKGLLQKFFLYVTRAEPANKEPIWLSGDEKNDLSSITLHETVSFSLHNPDSPRPSKKLLNLKNEHYLIYSKNELLSFAESYNNQASLLCGLYGYVFVNLIFLAITGAYTLLIYLPSLLFKSDKVALINTLEYIPACSFSFFILMLISWFFYPVINTLTNKSNHFFILAYMKSQEEVKS